MFHKTSLKNGLRLITAPRKSTKVATVLILLPVGSRYETRGINGMSHFVEHMMFKGTKRRPTSLDISKELDSIGAEFNAFTSKDYTGYYVKSSADQIELSLDILSDMLLQSKIDQIELEKERGVIVEEINMYEDNPLMYVENLFEQLVFKRHPLGRDISGPRHVIKTVPREVMLQFIAAHYHPSNMIVSVSGNIHEGSVKKLIQKYFGVSLRGKRGTFTRFQAYQKRPQVVLKHKETTQVQLALGFVGLSHFDKDLAAMQLLAIILGGNMSSRLFVNIREKHGLCYFIKSSMEMYHDTGTFVVQAGLDKERIDQAIALILAELRSIRDGGVTKKELGSAKDFLKGKIALGMEDSENLADWYGKLELFGKPLMTPEERFEKYILKVEQKDITRVAKRVIDGQKLNLAMIGPFKDRARFLKMLKM